MNKYIIVLVWLVLLSSLASSAISITNSNNNNQRAMNLAPASTSASVLFSQILGIDDNACSPGDFVKNLTFNNGNLQIVCDTPAGSGDITSVQGDAYITNGSNSGAVNLAFNETQLMSRGNAFGWNSTHNATYALFAYNQTTPAIADINLRFWNITQTWNRSQLYNITEVNNFNASWTTTFNRTYDNILSQPGISGKVVNGSLSNGTFIFTTVSAGADFTNVAYLNNTQTFTQRNTFSGSLNITSNIFFNTTTMNITSNATGIYIRGLTTLTSFL